MNIRKAEAIGRELMALPDWMWGIGAVNMVGEACVQWSARGAWFCEIQHTNPPRLQDPWPGDEHGAQVVNALYYPRGDEPPPDVRNPATMGHLAHVAREILGCSERRTVSVEMTPGGWMPFFLRFNGDVWSVPPSLAGHRNPFGTTAHQSAAEAWMQALRRKDELASFTADYR